jgi:hypothetical protein
MCNAGPARFDRVTRGPDGKFCHWFRGEPVNDPGAQPEQRPHDWPYCATERAHQDVAQHGTGAVCVGADGVLRHVPVHDMYLSPVPDPVGTTDALVALADLEAAAKQGPANPERVRQLAAKVRAALLPE